MTIPQKCVASVSSRSTETHAVAVSALRSQEDTSFVLPLPAGAATSVTGPCVPRSSS